MSNTTNSRSLLFAEWDSPSQKAVVFFLIRDGLVLLVERMSSSTGLGIRKYAGGGGKFEPDVDRTLEDTFLREFKEEIGTNRHGKTVCIPKVYRAVGQVEFYFPHKPEWEMSVEIFVVTEWDGDPLASYSEEVRPVWFDIRDIPWDKMWSDNQEWVPSILSGENVSCRFLYDEAGQIVERVIEDPMGNERDLSDMSDGFGSLG